MPKFPKLYKWRIAFLLTLTILSFGAIFPIHAEALSSKTLIDLTNQERTRAHLPSLTENSILDSSASEKARHMCGNDYWAHVGPDGKSPWQFMAEAGYPYLNAGENLAKGFVSDDTTIAAWMASPAHRANVLHTEFTEIGIAQTTCQLQGANVNLVVAHYGKPKKTVKKVVKTIDISAIQASLTIYHALSTIPVLGHIASRS